MHLNKQERAEHRARKNREKRKERRRMKMWHDLQARAYKDLDLWDERAKSESGREYYRSKVNRDCGMFEEDFETGKTTWRKK